MSLIALSMISGMGCALVWAVFAPQITAWGKRRSGVRRFWQNAD